MKSSEPHREMRSLPCNTSLTQDAKGRQVNVSRSSSSVAVAILIGLVLLLAACARGQPMSAGPVVTITSPSEGATIPTGQTVEIQSVATDNTTPIQRVEMYINGDLIADDSTPDPEGETSFTVIQEWVPVEPGEANVEVYAYNMDNERSSAATLTLNVEGDPLASAAPAVQTPTESLVEATAEPTPAPATPTPQPELTVSGSVIPQIGLNVRSGPGVNNERVGGVNVNESVTAVARNEAGEWVKIRYGDNQEGWVAAEFVSWKGDIQTLPVQ